MPKMDDLLTHLISYAHDPTEETRTGPHHEVSISRLSSLANKPRISIAVFFEGGGSQCKTRSKNAYSCVMMMMMMMMMIIFVLWDLPKGIRTC
jgi:hypothetical protein